MKVVEGEKTKLKRRLENMSKSELVALMQELVRLGKDNRAYVEAKLAGPSEIKEVIEYYKKIVEDEFFPKRGIGKIRLRTAKKAISDFKKANGDIGGVIDLMIYYVENGTRFTNEYGDIDERFYSSMESMFGNVTDSLNRIGDKELTKRFRPRLKKIVDDAKGIGWGYYDSLSYMLDELEGEG
ncbi:MAG: DUF6155 family protein [Halobacteriota archaeon]|nr:DUF6155 family protein [Halobacteriota archaeon]MDY6965015.1 DUF6155 family protein [Halobacteriota archaeon]